MLRKVVLLFITVVSAPVAVTSQTLELIEGAYELQLGNVSFPGSVVGSISFRDCADCGATTLRVDTATIYISSQGEQPLPEFLLRIAAIRAQPGAGETVPVTVFYNLDSGRITRIRVHDPVNGTDQ